MRPQRATAGAGASGGADRGRDEKQRRRREEGRHRHCGSPAKIGGAGRRDAAALILLAAAAVIAAYSIGMIATAHAQEVVEIVPEQPCFGVDADGRLLRGDEWNHTRIIEHCGAKEDWLGFTLLGWDWVTGGNFSLMFAIILILIVWAKYRVAIYPLYIGIVLMPVSWFLFPDQFLSFGLLLAGVAVGAYIWWIMTKQTE